MIASRLIAAFIVTYTFSLAVHADDFTRSSPNPEEIATLKRCLSPDKNYSRRLACLGLVSTPCRDTEDGVTTLGSNACYGREHRIWDSLLNTFYREAMAAATDNEKSYLKSTQTTWIKFREQACQWPYVMYPQGSISGPLFSECVMRQTAIRTLDLMDIRNTLRER